MERDAQVKGQPVWRDSLENDKFHLQENFWSDGTKPAVFIMPSQLGKHASPLNKMSIEVDQPVPGLHIFRDLAEEKINMVAVNMSKRGPVICVNS